MSTIVHFDVPAENIERVKKFYSVLLGWKFESYPEKEYNLITTTDLEGAPGIGGGMGKRMDLTQHIVNYFGVKSIDASLQQVKTLGGSILMNKMAVLRWDSLPPTGTPRAICSVCGKQIPGQSS